MRDDALGHLQKALSDSYAVEHEIERGGMAVVFLARDLKHRRSVAIKVLLPQLAATLATERFLREIDVIATLQHPHILTLIDSGEADGLPYYVMPFVEGQSLKERLRGEGTLPLETATRIAGEMADALAYAHDKGIIHRDIKPGNVLLSADHAIVADFGIAAALDQSALASLTDTGISLGSPAYMSPEQASGDGKLDARTDVYALGCVLYEMLAGRAPFEGSIRALATQKILGTVRPLEELRPDLPRATLAVVARAMAPAPDDRFPSADAFRSALLASLPAAEPKGRNRQRVLVAGAGVAVAAAVAAALLVRSAGQQALWAAQTLAEVEEFVERGSYGEALALAEQVESELPGDSTLARLLPQFTFTVAIRTDPPGARVYLQDMEGPEEAWEELGVTPLEGVRFAGQTFESEEFGVNPVGDQPYRVRFELEGYQDRELYVTALVGVNWRGVPPMDPVVLTPVDPDLEGMTRIPGFTRVVGGDTTVYADFFIDRFEVSNRDYQRFVDAGGYQNAEYWVHPFVRDGAELSFEVATAVFKDQTGRPGPATWRLGAFPEGQADFPVGGVSWYEAAAYARWVGKEIPTTVHRNRAALYAREDNFLVTPRSNLGTSGPRPVGRNRAMNTLGVYDLSGNVREWTANPADAESRITEGGAWTDAPFLVGHDIPKSAFDRDPTNGFRLIHTSDGEEALAALRFPVRPANLRDYRVERPAPDAEFQVFKRLYDYGRFSLNPLVERTDTSEHWVRETVSFDLPYGERGGAVLYLPRSAPRPVQVVLYWGGGPPLPTSIEEEFLPGFDFIVRSGRAVAVPMFAGSYGRVYRGSGVAEGSRVPPGGPTADYRDIQIQWIKDLRATIDYVESREDVAADRLGYLGFSWGGRMASQVLAVDPRIDAAVLNVGGLGRVPYLPEVDPINFVTRVRAPVLMINGRYDIVFDYETNQVPMFELLGTPAEHKRHYVSPAAHIVPKDEIITQALDWFDRYLGVPGR